MPLIPDMLLIAGFLAGVLFLATAGFADVFFEVTLFLAAADDVDAEFMPGMFFIPGMSALPFIPAIPALELSDIICM